LTPIQNAHRSAARPSPASRRASSARSRRPKYSSANPSMKAAVASRSMSGAADGSGPDRSAAERRSYSATHDTAVSWVAEYERLSAADRSGPEPSAAPDIERLATAAFMLGLAEEYFGLLERADEARLEAGEGRAALRCAFWIGV